MSHRRITARGGGRATWPAAVLAALLAVACDDQPDGSAEAAEGKAAAGGGDERAAKFRAMADRELAAKTPATPVEVAVVTRGLMESYYHGSTNLAAAEEAVVVARTQGVVQAIFVEEGDAARQGQPLAQLDTERLELEAARSRTQLENLKTAFERAEQLFATRMISPNEHDAAKFAFEAERNNLRLREYELREATIRATIDGVVTRRHIKAGHTLNQSAPAFEMKRLDSIEAILNVPEREIGRIRAGQTARVLVDALPDERFAGAVTRVAPEVDPASGTFRVTATLQNADGRLKPGMFSRVLVRVGQRPNTLVLPLAAVVMFRDKGSVFVVRDNGIAERRPVTTGYVEDDSIEILTGVREGERVVMTGQGGLRNGARVQVVGGYAGGVER